MEFFTTVLSHFTENLTNLIFNQDARDPKGLGLLPNSHFYPQSAARPAL